jgi:hypothetical protein
MYKKVLSFALIMVLSAFAQSQTLQQKKDMAKLKKVLGDIERRNKSGSFLISGKVVDEKGNPLDNVRVRITKSISRGFLESKERSHNKTVDGIFLLNEQGCNNIYLDFYKKGYFVTHKYYGIRMKPQKDISVSGNLVTAKNQIFVLREIGKLAKLRSKDRKYFLDPISQKQDIMDLISFKKVEVKTIKNIKSKKYFCLSVKSDAGGKPIMIFDQRTKKMVPEKIFLNYISNNKNDGLIIVDNARDMRDLPTAPEKGYVKKRVPLILNIYSNPFVFFYYKNGNTYGKVWVRNTSYIRGKIKSIFLTKENIETDPKEKRNLRSFAF